MAQSGGGQKYALNDPRNPNCPCHKLQKQAEEEFALQQKAVENKSVNTQLTVVAPGNIVSGKRMPHKHGMINGINLKRFKKIGKRKKWKRVRTDYNVCYKW